MTTRQIDPNTPADTGASHPAREGVRAAQRTAPAKSPARARTSTRPTRVDAYALARTKWLHGERLDVGQLARELGVSRATVFRWVGTREQLYGQVMFEDYAALLLRARSEGVGEGADLVADVTRRALTSLFAAKPLQTFLEQDTEFAMRTLTSKLGPTQGRAIDLETALLRELYERGEIRPALELETLAYIIVRICESFLYGNAIRGSEQDLGAAVAAVRILVAAEEHPPTLT